MNTARWFAISLLAVTSTVVAQIDTVDSDSRESALLSVPPAERLRYHTAPDTTRDEHRNQHDYEIPSVLVCDDGSTIADASQWFNQRRPELERHWTRILGKRFPTSEDRQWFGDIRAAQVLSTESRDGYQRIELTLPMEVDFDQPHLLLVPDGDGPFPAVIAWTSTSPDFREPEKWWGDWLARHGYVVLTGWSFIRHYRDETSHRNDVNQKVYDRFGHWLPMAKMVHDVQRECEFLASRQDVDAEKIGFIGFSLSAKAALYVAAFAPEVKATIAVDPHLAMHGATNFGDPWYLDWYRTFPTIHTPDYPHGNLQNTVYSLLDANPERPGFERNHHELLAMCAPRSLMVIGGSTHLFSATHSDDAQSWAYFNRGHEVYRLLGIPDHLQFIASDAGHTPTHPSFDKAWQDFFESQLKGMNPAN